MSLSSNRLNETRAPSITKLWNDRIRVERYFEIRNHEDAYDTALGTFLFEDFTALDGAPPSPAEPWTKEVREDRAFTNARLIEQAIRPPAGGDVSEPVLVKTYETLTSTLVEEIPDAKGQSDNGLDFINRTLIGLPEATFGGQVGTSTHPTETDLILNTFETENTDAYKRVVARYLKPGILSETEDFVGSQRGIVIEAFVDVPSTPSGYSLARTEESNVEGFKTLRYSFLKDNTVLSRTNDFVGSQLAVVDEVFNPPSVPSPPSGYLEGNRAVSNFEGIPTYRITFLKPGRLDESEGPGPAPGTTSFSITYFESDSQTTPDGILTNRRTTEFEGIPSIAETYVQGAIGEEEKFVFPTTIQITEPGTVELALENVLIETPLANTFIQLVEPGAEDFGVNVTDFVETIDIGSIPYVILQGPTQNKVNATVEQYISTTPDTSVPTAYQYKNFGVSVTEFSYTRNLANAGSTVNNQFIPQVKIVGAATLNGRLDSRVNFSQYSFTDRTIRMVQKGEEPATSGIYQIRNQPVFKALDGTQYYLVTRVILP